MALPFQFEPEFTEDENTDRLNDSEEDKSEDEENNSFSGIQPTGSLHLGNLFGAVKQWVDIQKQPETLSIISIVDYHAITLPQQPEILRNNTLEMIATLLACGVNPDKTILFQQSKVTEHTELAWLLGCITTMARLSHLPQYKEKKKLIKEIPLGIYTYPVLQSADILLYKTTTVPVGEDQLQHVQLAQHLAEGFNKKFGKCFPIPKVSVGNHESLPKVMSLRNPDIKMSKSDADPKSVINVIDSPNVIREKLKKAVTDCTSAVEYDPEKRHAVANLIKLHSHFSGKSIHQICCENKNLDTGKYKMVIADELIEYLKPIQEEVHELLNNPSLLQQKIEMGSARAKEIALNTITEVKSKMGLI
ncbi:Tryptophan--tRNA ligase, mitochondrial [Nymphon striatum]|nr:Tryptophan--tRNA ligase, mitochondrial [Nymphon striatum]